MYQALWQLGMCSSTGRTLEILPDSIPGIYRVLGDIVITNADPLIDAWLLAERWPNRNVQDVIMLELLKMVDEHGLPDTLDVNRAFPMRHGDGNTTGNLHILQRFVAEAVLEGVEQAGGSGRALLESYISYPDHPNFVRNTADFVKEMAKAQERYKRYGQLMFDRFTSEDFGNDEASYGQEWTVQVCWWEEFMGGDQLPAEHWIHDRMTEENKRQEREAEKLRAWRLRSLFAEARPLRQDVTRAAKVARRRERIEQKVRRGGRERARQTTEEEACRRELEARPATRNQNYEMPEERRAYADSFERLMARVPADDQSAEREHVTAAARA